MKLVKILLKKFEQLWDDNPVLCKYAIYEQQYKFLEKVGWSEMMFKWIVEIMEFLENVVFFFDTGSSMYLSCI